MVLRVGQSGCSSVEELVGCDWLCAVRTAAAEAETMARPLAVEGPLLAEEDLFAVRALVDAHAASVVLGRGGVAAWISLVMLRWR